MAFGKQPTAAQAVEQNKQAILLFVKASGPVEYHQLLRECAAQAHGNDALVGAAIEQLLSEKQIAREWEGASYEGDEGYYSYDLA